VEAIKKSGTNITVVAIGGFRNLDSSEEAIASRKADMIGDCDTAGNIQKTIRSAFAAASMI